MTSPSLDPVRDAEEMLAALNRIFPRQRPFLMLAALRIVRDRQLAEDLAQDAYVRAAQAIETTPVEHIEAFLHKTVRNLALDSLRRRRTRQSHEDHAVAADRLHEVAAGGPSIESVMIERERLRLFEAALQSLPERARRAWALSQVHGWTYGRIAAHLGVSRNTIYNDVKLVMGHCRDALARFERG